jgi:hypothetical protein
MNCLRNIAAVSFHSRSTAADAAEIACRLNRISEEKGKRRLRLKIRDEAYEAWKFLGSDVACSCFLSSQIAPTD